MSYMSPLEMKARKSYAISALNRLRHKINERPNANFSENFRNALIESIEINTASELTSKMLLYSFHGMSNIQNTSAIQIADALKDSLLEMRHPNPTSFFILLRQYISGENESILEDRALLNRILISTINKLSVDAPADSLSNLYTYDI
jgi:hypothetical protein